MGKGGSQAQYVQGTPSADQQAMRTYLLEYLKNGMQNGYQGQLNAPTNPWTEMAGNQLAGMYSAGQPQALAAHSQFLSKALGQSSTPAMFNPTPVSMTWQAPQYQQDAMKQSSNTGTNTQQSTEKTWILANPKGNKYTTDPNEVAAFQSQGSPFNFVMLVGPDGKLTRV